LPGLSVPLAVHLRGEQSASVDAWSTRPVPGHSSRTRASDDASLQRALSSARRNRRNALARHSGLWLAAGPLSGRSQDTSATPDHGHRHQCGSLTGLASGSSSVQNSNFSLCCSCRLNTSPTVSFSMGGRRSSEKRLAPGIARSRTTSRDPSAETTHRRENQGQAVGTSDADALPRWRASSTSASAEASCARAVVVFKRCVDGPRPASRSRSSDDYRPHCVTPAWGLTLCRCQCILAPLSRASTTTKFHFLRSQSRSDSRLPDRSVTPICASRFCK